VVSGLDDQILPLRRQEGGSQKPTLYHSDQYIKVSSKLIRLGGTDYSVRNLTSVSRVRVDPDQTSKMLVYAIIGGLIGFVVGSLVGTVFASNNFSAQINFSLIALVIGVVVGSASVLWRTKPKFFVRFKTASGEEGELEANQYDYVERVANAIARAMMENQ
jgi:hypothetical protein